MPCVFAPHALLADGWARDVRLDVAADGTLAAVTPGAAPDGAECAAGPVIPGMPNVHSHAFQRAMAGLAELRSAERPNDSFWSWREAMYALVERLQPDHLEAIAARLYVELLRGGFTSVAEFHYLHHGPGGAPYADLAATSLRVVDAACAVGMRITHLPVLYMRGGFDDRSLSGAQLRFRTDPDTVEAIRVAVAAHCAGRPAARTGLALHSLRAVDAGALRAAVAALRAADAAAPIHIHAAEQVREVEDCIAATGQRPVEWLLREQGLDQQWCVVHATHLTAAETESLARCGAIAGLCPTTEANLGDGLFPLPLYLERRGSFGIGSDSHVGRSAADELRWLEYGQRLQHGRRNIAAAPDRVATGARLWTAAAGGGAAALAQPVGALAPGMAADLLVLDGNHPDLEQLQGDAILDALVFGAGDALIRDVMVAGQWVVRERRHERDAAIASAYRAALRALRS